MGSPVYIQPFCRKTHSALSQHPYSEPGCRPSHCHQHSALASSWGAQTRHHLVSQSSQHLHLHTSTALGNRLPCPERLRGSNWKGQSWTARFCPCWAAAMGNHFLQVWDHMDSLVAYLLPFFYHAREISRKYHSFWESQVSYLSPSPLLQVLPLPK